MRPPISLVGALMLTGVVLTAQQPAPGSAPVSPAAPQRPTAPATSRRTPGGQAAGAPASQPPATQAGGDGSDQPVFRADINFVRVDVIATDRQGNPVDGLTKDDFEVFEDGKPQAIDTFRLIRVDTTAPEYTTRSIRSRQDEENAAADESARIFVFFLDDYNVRVGNAMAARREIADFIRTQVAPNDLLAVMYPLTPLDAVVLTRNHESIIRTIEQFEGRKFRYQPRNAIEDKYAQQPTEIVERIRRQVSLSALKGLSVKLGALREGRKAIVLISEGYTAMLPPQMRDAVAGFTGLGNNAWGNPLAGENDINEQRARTMAEFDLQSELQSVFDAANRTNTAIYAVDPRGLSTGEFDIQDNVGSRQSQEALRQTMTSLQILAENTDGRAIINRNDLSEGMKQIVRDSSAYYLIGYNSTQAPQDGRFHQIRVRLKKPGIQVRARKGYWALSPSEAVRAAAPAPTGPPPAVAKAVAGLAPAGIGARRYVRTWSGVSSGDEGRTRVTFVWEPVPAPPGVRRDEMTAVTLTATTAAGTPVFSGPVGLIDASRLAQVVAFDAPPGKLRLKVAVEGSGGMMLDNEDRELAVPDLTGPELRLSTPRVFVARTAREYQQLKATPAATPAATREFRRTDRMLVRVEPVAGAGVTASVTARLLNKQGQKMLDLPADAAPSAPTDRQVELPLSSLPVGDYLLELSATAADAPAVTELVAFRVTG
ncbi:MAG: VWA domain-containing protein [Acidobacteria bacterium]|nr:VWA domain-containing protein [Acidobacteriota bacterium]